MRVLSLIVASAAVASAGRFAPIRKTVDPEKREEVQAACAPELAQCGYTEDLTPTELREVFQCMKDIPKSDICTAALPPQHTNKAEKLEEIKEACTTELADCGYVEGMEPAELWEVMKCVKSSELSDVCEAALPAKPGRHGGRGPGNRAEKLEAIQEFCDDELAACGYVEGMTREEMISVLTCMKSSELSDVCAAALPAKASSRADKLEEIKETCADELAACGYVEGMTEKEELFPVWQCMKTSELSEECTASMPSKRGDSTGKFGRGGRGGKFGGRSGQNARGQRQQFRGRRRF